MSTIQRIDGSPAPRKMTSEILDRLPPSNLEAEHCVLGSILQLPDVCDDVVMILRADDFYDDVNRKLFKCMLDLHDSGRKVDPALLVEELKRANDYDAMGGAGYLVRISQAVPNAAHATYYAQIVRNKATYRSLINASTEILRDAYDESGDASETLSRAEQKIFSILDSRSNSNLSEIRDILHDAMDRIDARLKGEVSSSGVKTGFTDFDTLTGGLHGSELIILAARPSMGKTALAMNIAEHVTANKERSKGKPTLFVSLEMSSIELADRLLCSASKVNSHRLRNGTISNEDRLRLVEKASHISESPLFVDDSPSRTVTEIAAAARRIQRRHGNLSLIVIDYLQLIEPDNSKDPRQEQVAKIARRLKGLAREMNVPVLCLAQLNRQTEASNSNRPKLSHLRESGAIEQDADVVMFVHREEYYHAGEDDVEQYAGKAQLIVSKQRNGPIGDIDLLWHKDHTRFENEASKHMEAFDDFNNGVDF